jgi:hypothetical protein
MVVPHIRNVSEALAVLDAAVAAADHQPQPASRELRLALACLHLIAGGDRDPFDRFWRAATGRHSQSSDTMEGYSRRIYMAMARDAIRRQLGVTYSDCWRTPSAS